MASNVKYASSYKKYPLYGRSERFTMSTSSSNCSSTSVRKQMLPLKPKQNISVQRLECKNKKTEVPITTLELKKDKIKVNDKNIVTNLMYRKRKVEEIDRSIQTSPDGSRRSGSPSSSGYETDSFTEFENQENFDSFSTFSSAYANCETLINNHCIDMLHSHPIWAPVTDLYASSNINNNRHYGFYSNENPYLL